MNQLIRTTEGASMSSREIAELTGKDHKNVLADIRAMCVELGISLAEISAVYKDQQLIDRPCFNLRKRETLILVSGYRIDLRAKIIDRWQELEQQVSQPAIPQTYAEALRLAADQAEQLAIAAPKAEAFERLSVSDGEMNLTAAAKVLQQAPRWFVNYLKSKSWIYKRAGSSHNLGYQDKVKAGYLTHKVSTVLRQDGTEKTCEQVLITSAGLAKLRMMLGAA